MAAKVVAIVQLPPPVTGLSAVNRRMVETLEGSGELAASVDVSPPGGASGVHKHVARLGRTLVAALALATARRQGSSRLYMPSDGGPGIIWNILLMVVARLLGFRVWVHHHSFAYVNDRSPLMALQLWLAPRGTRHLALCATMLEGLSLRYAAAWASRDHSGVVLSNAFMPGSNTTPYERSSVLTIGHLSNLTEVKGVIRFLDLFRAAKIKGIHIRALVAGPIGDSRSRAAIEATLREFPDDFRWLGPVYGPDKDAFYGSIDAFVFPSDYVNEAQPLVLLEALAAGAAVLATDRGCMGCDHAASPGLIAPVSQFHDLALHWLLNHESPSARQGLPRRAAEAFNGMRATAKSQLASVIDEIGKG